VALSVVKSESMFVCLCKALSNSQNSLSFMKPKDGLPCSLEPPLVCILSHMNAVHTILPSFFHSHFNVILIYFKSEDSLFSILTRLCTGQLRSHVQFLGRPGDFALSNDIQTGSGMHPGFCVIGL
jgi:hypothetical protein